MKFTGDLRPATLLKKRLWYMFFPLNFAKFLRAPFTTEHLWWLLLIHLWNQQLHVLFRSFRISHSDPFYKKWFSSKFRRIYSKHLFRVFFFLSYRLWCPQNIHTYLNKPATESMYDLLVDTMACNFIKKETQLFSCEFYKIFKNTFLYSTTPVAPSGVY